MAKLIMLMINFSMSVVLCKGSSDLVFGVRLFLYLGGNINDFLNVGLCMFMLSLGIYYM